LLEAPGDRAREKLGEEFMRRFTAYAIAAAMMAPATTTPANAYIHARGYHGKMWQDGQGRWRCKRSNGTTGLIVGAAGGALLGRAVDTRGERATGTILGAAAGALIGREIDRSRVRCR
jgi:hypothetical protein